MKKNILTLLSGLFVVCTLFFVACGEENKCTNECGVHGTLVQTNCSCNCEAGYKLDVINGRCDVKIACYDMIGDFKSTSVKRATLPSTVEKDYNNYTINVSEALDDATGQKVRLKNLSEFECTVNGVVAVYYVEGAMKGDSVIFNKTACKTDFVGKGFFTRDATTKKVTKFTVVYNATYDVTENGVTKKVTDKCTEVFSKN